MNFSRFDLTHVPSGGSRWLALLLVAFLPISLWAGTTGKIAGLVTDQQTGEPLVGVNVYLEGQPFGGATDVDGYYYILNVPPGTYTVVAQIVGYQDVRYTNVQVNVDLTTKLNFGLGSQAIEGEEVTVTAERPLVQMDVTASSTQVSSAEIEALPVDNFNEVVELQAGVVDGHFRGGRLGEVSYMIDGIPVNDPYNNGMTVAVENSMIQQLEVISGTFNAEYGQAMSGIVNIVTREGGNDYEGNVQAYAGNYYTNDERLFPGLDEFDMSGETSVTLSLSGPVPGLGDKLRFFATGRLVNNDGHLYGLRRFPIDNDDPFLPLDSEVDGVVYDSSAVPMNDYESKSLQGKLTYYLTPSIKVNYNAMWGDNFNNYYDHGFRLAPDGIMDHFRTNLNQSLSINHGVSNNTFYTLRFSHNRTQYEGYVFEDPFDDRYVIPERGQPQSNYTYRYGGNQTNRYDRTTTTLLGKFDLTSQVTKVHKIGIGAEYKQHRLEAFGTNLTSDTQFPDDIFYPEPFSVGRQDYDQEPIEFAAYIQDKMEFEDFIINAGLRFDYFNARTDVLTNRRNPENNPLFPFGNEPSDANMQVSPRLGVAFPISSSGVIHVAYGHFFQIPNFEQIYEGIQVWPDGTTRYAIASNGLNTVIGNPELDAQRTVTYEMGIKQGLTEELAVEFTAYYRDIRNLVGTQIIETSDTKQYARYINTDYGNVQGIVLSFEKRFADHWGARLDYTYQIAKGNASDPRSAFFNNQSDPPTEPEKQVIPLDWDQRSTLNMSVNTGTPGSWNVGLVGRIGTGTPYTAEVRYTGVNVNFQNNRYKPSRLTFDLKADKTVKLLGTNVQAFMWVENLFDQRNELGVYGSTGRAGRDLNAFIAGDVIGVHSIDDNVLNPSMYSAPRQVRLGLAFGF